MKTLRPRSKAPRGRGYIALLRAARRLEPSMRRAFLRAVERVRGRVDLAALEQALAAGDLAGAEAATFIDEFAAAFGASAAVVRRALQAGGEVAAAQLGATLPVELSFNLTNPHAVAWLRQHGAQLVREVSAETKAALREIIAIAYEEGVPPKKAARLIRDLVGLTRHQTRAVLNFRRGLIEQGVSGAALDRRVQRYYARTLRRRGQTIARHETLTGANRGQLELWRQAREQGLIRIDLDRRWLTGDGSLVSGPPAHIQCRCVTALEFLEDGTAWIVWIVTPDDRLCPICEPIPTMPENQPAQYP